MPNLIRQLAMYYPDWRDFHSTPIEAAVEVGLLDETDLPDTECVELDFNE